MKVVAILGGLGSQMLKYAFYLSLCEKTEDDCYITTTPFETMQMWNGYELEKIFGIVAPKLEDIVPVEKTNNYTQNILRAIKKHCKNKQVYWFESGILRKYNNDIIFVLRKIKRQVDKYIKVKGNNVGTLQIDRYPSGYENIKENVLYDEFNHTSDIYIKAETVDLKKVFCFPAFEDKKNIEISMLLQNTNSVAMCVRRSDHMYDNARLFETGYFKKAMDYIRTREGQLVVCVFSEDMEWCKNNIHTLGVDLDKDVVIYADWNSGQESFRDMQLMTYCKHNILSISSFGWWGYYLSKQENKIVCAPTGYWNEVSNHF